ncbi:MAG: NCS2 family permease [Clostridia bacterium]
MNNFKSKLDNFFQITERGSTVKTEIVAGLTTFFAMCYILAVNPIQMIGMFNGASNAPHLANAVFIATALGAIVGTVLLALYAKMPYAQAPGMGLNSFFFVSFMLPMALNGSFDFETGYMKGLAVILISGVLFLVLSLTGARKAIVRALPDCLKKAIPAGIGLFIAFIGLQSSGIIQSHPYVMTQLGDISILQPWLSGQPITMAWTSVAPILVAFFGFMLIAILSKYKIKGSLIIGIIVTTFLYYFVTWQLPSFSLGDIGSSFKDFGKFGIGAAFKGFKPLFTFGDVNAFAGILNIIMLVITFCLVDMFDTMGTLQGTASEAGMLDEDGIPQNIDKCLVCDAAATVVGAIVGTSTVTTYVESAAGVAQGGRTGLTALVVTIMFIIALFLRPLFAIIPAVATAPALIWVGVLMLKNFKLVDMDDIGSAVPAFLTLIIMPLSYSISNGIAIGMISYTIIALATGKFKKKDILVAILGLLFLLRFLFIKM